MPPFEPGKSGNPKGKPRGTRSRYTRYRAALEKDLPVLLEVAKKHAMAGDRVAMKLLLERTMPAMKRTSAPVRILGFDSATTMTEKAEAVLDAVAVGIIPADLGSQLIQAVNHLGQLKAIDEFEQRLQQLEAATGNT